MFLQKKNKNKNLFEYFWILKLIFNYYKYSKINIKMFFFFHLYYNIIELTE
jgi:hypothetical protein